MSIKSVVHGSVAGTEIVEYILTDGSLTVHILNVGASIYKIITPDAEGQFDDIVLGYSDFESYLDNKDYFGCLTGRVANRIAHSRFNLNGQTFIVSANEGSNCLHGGVSSLSTKVFEPAKFDEKSTSLILICHSADGESGFPGHLKVSVTYTLEDGQLSISYEAISDSDTVINLTNHSYFNLAGHGKSSILEHEIEIPAKSYLPVDDKMIPLQASKVEGTPFDFRSMSPLKPRLGAPFEQIQRCYGFDHSFLLNEGSELQLAAKVQHSYNGRTLECWTTEPAVHLYTANHIDGMTGKGDAYYGKFPAFCLETQHYPDSPNRVDFPSVKLKSGEVYNSKTIYRFGTLNDH